MIFKRKLSTKEQEAAADCLCSFATLIQGWLANDIERATTSRRELLAHGIDVQFLPNSFVEGARHESH